jgi:N-acetylglutamate synthase-like GNAT family acetyltransferase
MQNDINIRHELQVGDLGRIITLHGTAYDALPGYGLKFEAYVARTVAEYYLDAGGVGRIWMAEIDQELVGCAAMVLREGGLGQLRWVLVDASTRGIGLGRELVNRTLDYARNQRCSSVFLETTDGLPESQQLYEKLGFSVTSNEREELWDGERPLIRMTLPL